MFTPDLIPELQKRWAGIRTALQAAGSQGLLLSTNVSNFYVSGRVFRGFTYLPVEGSPVFFVRRPLELTGDGVVYIKRPEEIPAYLIENGYPLPKSLLLESESLSHAEYLKYTSLFGVQEAGNGSALMRTVRSIKTDYEIEQLRQSGRMHARAYRKIPSVFRPGMNDVQFSIEVERLLRLSGSLGIFRIAGSSMEIFMGSIVAGDNADNPSPYDFAMGGAGLNPSLPVGINGTPLTEGTSIMVDMGGNFTGYMTDMTRVFSVGKLSELAYRAHQTALEIQDMFETTAREGVPTAELYQRSVQMAAGASLGDFFMGHRQKAGFVGHGVGIEINEAPVLAPRSKDVLEKGMVVAFEPKFVIPGTGAVGIENTYAVTADGVEKLTLLEEEIIQLQ